MNKTMHLIEYAMQVRDAYQSQIDAKQNNTMQYLSVISTIFFPLTLITGWYGMNFKDMPGLEGGYPGSGSFECDRGSGLRVHFQEEEYAVKTQEGEMCQVSGRVERSKIRLV